MTEQQEFKLGDRVFLKGSDSPAMTIVAIAHKPTCGWFDNHRVYHQESFSREVLSTSRPIFAD